MKKISLILIFLASYSLSMTCESNQFFDTPQNKCRICYESKDEKCQECETISECKTCNVEYLLDATKKCISCPSGCKDCTGDVQKCVTCSPGYSLKADSTGCIQCSQNCKKCTATDACTECFDGFNLDSASKSCKMNEKSPCQILKTEATSDCRCPVESEYFDNTTKSCQSCYSKHNECARCTESKCLYISDCSRTLKRKGGCTTESDNLAFLGTMFVIFFLAAVVCVIVILGIILYIVAGSCLLCVSDKKRPQQQ